MYDCEKEEEVVVVVAVERSALRDREGRLAVQPHHLHPHSRAHRRQPLLEVARRSQEEVERRRRMYDRTSQLEEAKTIVLPACVVGVESSISVDTSRSCLSHTPCLHPEARLPTVRVRLASWTRLANSVVVMLTEAGFRWRLRYRAATFGA
jgi:hypothetical protein